jgi:membrane associated rhomboid family serine protease
VLPLHDDLPTSRPPVLTVALLAANVGAFLWQLSVGLPQSVLAGGAIPYELLTLQDVTPPDLVPPPFTLFTSMFLHGGFAHLGGNMLFLWVFGNNVEDALGHVRFLAFYLLAGTAAGLAQTLASWLSGQVFVPMVGASGAIAGLLAAYAMLFPRARVLTWIPPIWLLRLPAALVIGAWFFFQLMGAFFGGDGTVAFTAHLGGFAAGWLMIRRWKPGGRRLRG